MNILVASGELQEREMRVWKYGYSGLENLGHEKTGAKYDPIRRIFCLSSYDIYNVD